MSGTRSPGLRIELLRQARDSGREAKKARWRHLWTEVWLVDQGATIATCGWNTTYYEFWNIVPACWYLETWGFLDSCDRFGIILAPRCRGRLLLNAAFAPVDPSTPFA